MVSLIFNCSFFFFLLFLIISYHFLSLCQAEVRELRARLAELQERGAALHEQIAHEEQQQELEEVEGPVLHSCDPAHLRQMGRALEDLLTSQHRTRICLSPPPLLNR